MEFEIILKSAMALAAIFGIAKIIHDFSAANKNKLREEYKFAKDFLRDIAQEPKPHPFAVEKGFFAIAGTTAIKSKEIEYILSLENAHTCLNDYVTSRTYLEHIDRNGSLKIQFANKYKSALSRKWRKAAHVLAYAIFAFIALSPFVLFKPLALSLNQFLAVSAFTIPVLGYLAISSLLSFIKIKRAEALVASQSRHTKLILVKEKSA